MENNENSINPNEINFTKEIMDNLRVSNYTTGQRWITLKGDFTSAELYEIADKIEAAYNNAFKKNK